MPWRAAAHPKATDERPPRDPAGDAALVAGYEQLRAAALAGGGGHGVALLATRGMAAWIAAWRGLAPAAGRAAPVVSAPAGVASGGAADEVVAVLASMAAACVAGGER